MKVICGFSSFFILLAFAATLAAKEWHGITPLHSTRADVTRLLGQSIDLNDTSAKYNLDKEYVNFLFTADDSQKTCGKQLPAGTVLQIEIIPKSPIPLSQFPVDDKRFTKYASVNPYMPFSGYVDVEDGLILRVNNETIQYIQYIAASKDADLCPLFLTRKFAYITGESPCPSIRVECPDTTKAGTEITFGAKVEGGAAGVKLSYHWEVNAGRIISGEGTTGIVVDTQGVSGEYVTATIEADGLDPACGKRASCIVYVVKGEGRDSDAPRPRLKP